MIYKRLLLLFITFSLLQNISVTHANEDRIDALFTWLDSFNSLSGTFNQTHSNTYDGFALESAGDFEVLKPNYLKWHQTSPDNQLVLSEIHMAL